MIREGVRSPCSEIRHLTIHTYSQKVGFGAVMHICGGIYNANHIQYIILTDFSGDV